MPLYSVAINEASITSASTITRRWLTYRALWSERDYYVENGHVKERDDNTPAFDDLVYKKRFGVVDPGYVDGHAGVTRPR